MIDYDFEYCGERMLLEIDALPHEELARLWRFARVGHPYFSVPQLFARFEERFRLFGGMTPELSKRIGWDAP